MLRRLAIRLLSALAHGLVRLGGAIDRWCGARGGERSASRRETDAPEAWLELLRGIESPDWFAFDAEGRSWSVNQPTEAPSIARASTATNTPPRPLRLAPHRRQAPTSPGDEPDVKPVDPAPGPIRLAPQRPRPLAQSDARARTSPAPRRTIAVESGPALNTPLDSADPADDSPEERASVRSRDSWAREHPTAQSTPESGADADERALPDASPAQLNARPFADAAPVQEPQWTARPPSSLTSEPPETPVRPTPNRRAEPHPARPAPRRRTQHPELPTSQCDAPPPPAPTLHVQTATHRPALRGAGSPQDDRWPTLPPHRVVDAPVIVVEQAERAHEAAMHREQVGGLWSE
jgi:hypothetical protein